MAKAVGLPAAAKGERLRKREHAGGIRGYQVVIDPAAVGLGICAFVAIAPQPRKPAETLVAGLLSMPEIMALHAVAGTYADVAKVRANDTLALDGFLDQPFMLESVVRTETTMVLRTDVERRISLPWSHRDDA